MSSAREIIPGMMKTATGTLASRMLGLVREVLTAGLFGAGMAMDMFAIAFRIPNLFRAFFGEGSMNAAFVPVFAREQATPGGDPRRLLNAVMTALGVVLLAITVLGWILCGTFLFIGPREPKTQLFWLLLLILLPYLPLICLSALQAAALNVKGHFLRPALAPTLMNICWIGAALLFGRRYGVKALAVGILVSGVLQFLWQAAMLRGSGLAFRPVWDLAHPGLRRIVQMMLPAALGVGVIQVNTFVDSIIAEFCVPGDGAVSALRYGNQLMQFPLGVLGIALGTAVLPAFARRRAENDEAGFRDAANLALRTALFLSLPCVAMIAALNAPIVRVVFEHGKFTAESTARTAPVLLHYGIGLWAFCGVHVLARGFYAQQDTVTPTRVAAMMVLVNLGLNLTLVWSMREAGLALASSLAGVGNVSVLYVLLRRRIGSMGGRLLAMSGLKAAAASAVAAVIAYFVNRRLAGPAFTAQAVALAVSLAAGGAAYLLVLLLTGSRELHEFRAALAARSRQ